MDTFGVKNEDQEITINIIIVGNGKLAHSLYEGLKNDENVFLWDAYDKDNLVKSILLHVGSGRQLKECMDYCNQSDSILLELSTGMSVNSETVKCTVIECPNVAMPVLKLMMMFNSYGNHFHKYKMTILESHQETKKAIAGTAFEIAKALQAPLNEIISIREKEKQLNEIGIPQAYLDLHAYHKIVIEEEGCELKIEMKVLGHQAYVDGTKEIIKALKRGNFEKRTYSIIELIKDGVI